MVRFTVPCPSGPWSNEHLDWVTDEVATIASEVIRRRRAQEAEVHEMLVQVLLNDPSFGQSEGGPPTVEAVRSAFSRLQPRDDHPGDT